MATLGKEERIALIKENLQEVLNFDIIEKVLDEGRHPKIYWGKLNCLEARRAACSEK
jgi:tyrosyl-tRNA synthetase